MVEWKPKAALKDICLPLRANVLALDALKMPCPCAVQRLAKACVSKWMTLYSGRCFRPAPEYPGLSLACKVQGVAIDINNIFANTERSSLENHSMGRW